MFEWFWSWFGYEDLSDKPILCLNSLHHTDRKINWVMKRIAPDDDSDTDSETDVDEYIRKYYD